MEKTLFIIAIFLLGYARGQAVGCSGVQEDYGHVEVRPGAHMFWVTYHTELEGDWSQHPLIMWLQGGPGSSSVGYGNFWLLGPCDINGNIRESRWTQKANLMFVDNPVGAGYSYVDDLADLTTTNDQIAQDLVSLLINVYLQYPEKQNMPFFIYSESYGGKMAIDFSLLLLEAIDNGDIICNFQGVVLGDSWTSPIDYVNTWGPFLYELGFVNDAELENIETAAAATQVAVDEEDWVRATNLWAATQGAVFTATGGIDFYNVHAEDSSFYSPEAALAAPRGTDHFKNVKPELRDAVRRQLGSYRADPLDIFMNGEQKLHWNISDDVIWGGQSGAVFDAQEGDFMKPVVDSVSEAIDLARIHVGVYTGNLDLICDTPGTYLWINNMNYSIKEEFDNSNRVDMNVPEYPNLAWYYQRSSTFSLHTFLRAGHMMPLDVPTGALDMIDLITLWGAEASGAYKVRKEAEKKLKEHHLSIATKSLKQKIRPIMTQEEATKQEVPTVIKNIVPEKLHQEAAAPGKTPALVEHEAAKKHAVPAELPKKMVISENNPVVVEPQPVVKETSKDKDDVPAPESPNEPPHHPEGSAHRHLRGRRVEKKHE